MATVYTAKRIDSARLATELGEAVTVAESGPVGSTATRTITSEASQAALEAAVAAHVPPDNAEVAPGGTVVLSGVLADRPDPSDLPPGSLYFVTDEAGGGGLYRTSGLAWAKVAASPDGAYVGRTAEFKSGDAEHDNVSLAVFAAAEQDYPVSYFNDGGHFYSLTAMNLNAAYPDEEGYARVNAATDLQFSLSVWTDVAANQTSIYVRSNPNKPRNIVLGDQHGYRRLEMQEDGGLAWAGAGSGNTLTGYAPAANDAAKDVWLFRSAAAQLQLGDNAGGSDAHGTARAGASFGVNIAALGGAGLSVQPASANGSVAELKAFPAQAVPMVRFRSSSNAVYGGVTKSGYLYTAKNAAPADAELAVNELAWWFDSSNGASKVMFKGKSADGTVVTGEVALA